LKLMLLRLEMPGLILAQVRRLEQHDIKPRIDHLRDTGALEQDADQIVLLHMPNDPVSGQENAVMGHLTNRHGPGCDWGNDEGDSPYAQRLRFKWNPNVMRMIGA